MAAVEGEDGSNLQDAMAANFERKVQRRQQQQGTNAGSPASTADASRYGSADDMSEPDTKPAEKRKRGRPSTAASVTPSVNGDDEPRVCDLAGLPSYFSSSLLETSQNGAQSQ